MLERIYPQHHTNYSVVPIRGTVIKKDFPEVEEVLHEWPFNNTVVSYTTDKGELLQFEENNMMAAESTFRCVLDIKLLKGDPKTVKENTDVVVMESTAKRYFGNEDPIGKASNYSSRVSCHGSFRRRAFEQSPRMISSLHGMSAISSQLKTS